MNVIDFPRRKITVCEVRQRHLGHETARDAESQHNLT